MNSILITALAALFVFGLLITSHELGHFVAAKLSGVCVLEFAIGMGPKLFSFKKGETLYSLRLLPIGGYNKMLGEQEKSDDPRAFSNQNPWKRLVIIIAGAFMNFLIAFILFLLYTHNTGVIIPTIGKIMPNHPAAIAGIKVGDEIKSVNGIKITEWSGFTNFVNSNKGKDFSILVKRGSNNLNFKLKPQYNKQQKRYLIGVEGTFIKEAFSKSVSKSAALTVESIKQMFGFFGKLFGGKISSGDVGGPVAIVKMSGQAASLGIWTLLYFTGFLSVNLGFVNLIPFPALDGGWVIILLYEALTGKKIDENKIGFVNLIGFAVLIGFIILVTFNDVARL